MTRTTMAATVAAIVPEYNEPAEAINLTVRGLVSQSVPPERIVVVDDASPVPADPAPELAPLIELIRLERNVGVGGARNRAAEVVDSDYLLFVNCDVVLDPRYIERALEFMQRHEDVGAVSGQIIPRAGSPALRRWRLQHIETSVHRVAPDGPTEVSWIVGHVFFVRREAYERVGGFDARLWLRGEDAIFCEQLAALGYRIVHLPDLLAESHESIGIADMAWKAVRNQGWDIWCRAGDGRESAEAKTLRPVTASVSMLALFASYFARDLIKRRIALLPVDVAVAGRSVLLIWQRWRAQWSGRLATRRWSPSSN